MGTGFWQLVFVGLVVGVPAIICVYVVIAIVRAVLRSDPSADFLEHLAGVTRSVVTRWRRPPGPDDR